MDLEDLALRHLKGDTGADEILRAYLSDEERRAILKEVQNSLHPTLRGFQPITVGLKAGESGLGCRGFGDALIHRALISLLPGHDLLLGPSDMDDSGVIRLGDRYLVVSVDGVHSRLSRFPFLAGFHVARASLRDVMVKGAEPLAMTSDIHIGDDGDVGKVLEFTAGIALVSELTAVPVASGSTLRIGGDMVKGDRLTGSVSAIGVAERIFSRKKIMPGDVLLITRGAGGGTIATTAIYNGWPEVVRLTLNMDFYVDWKTLMERSEILHTMTDITNGGIRGDALDMARFTGMDVYIDGETFLKSIHPDVLGMLESLSIDPMGISTDSLLIAVAPDDMKVIMDHMRKKGRVCLEAGQVEDGEGRVFIDGKEIRPSFREAPYTPIKKVVSENVFDVDMMTERLEKSVEEIRKKMHLFREVVTGGTGGMDTCIQGDSE